MPERPRWTFLTSHASMIIEVSRAPDATVRELAVRSDLTERQAHRVLADLVEAGYVERRRVGRRNHYRVNEEQPLRRSSVADRRVGELLSALSR
ncbi:MAG TPA: helix-turn-helix domain-containing protein [Gaiellaceae bacterium]|nr:helix-turn-helix domain-containing protein [Gaiellaceae bacterium]